MKICMVGYGSIARSHMQALNELGGVTYDSVVGRLLEPSQEFAQEWGFTHATTDLDEALARPGLDAVIICSPSDAHAAQAEAALKAGKHVLVEIPLATNLADAERVNKLAHERNLRLMVAHTQRFYPGLVEARRRIAAGALTPHHLVFRWWFLRRENVNWAGRRRSWTDNLLWHHSCHSVDTALWLLGLPESGQNLEVYGQLAPPSTSLGIPLDLDIQMRTATGQLVSISMSYNSPWSTHDYVVIGEEETLAYVEGELRNKEGQDLTPPKTNSIREQDQEFFAAIRENREPSVNGDSVMPTMRVLQYVQDHGEYKK